MLLNNAAVFKWGSFFSWLWGPYCLAFLFFRSSAALLALHLVITVWGKLSVKQRHKICSADNVTFEISGENCRNILISVKHYSERLTALLIPLPSLHSGPSWLQSMTPRSCTLQSLFRFQFFWYMFLEILKWCIAKTTYLYGVWWTNVGVTSPAEHAQLIIMCDILHV